MSFVDFVVFPSGHGNSVKNFWDWAAHEAHLRCPDGVWVVLEGDVVLGGGLKHKLYLSTQTMVTGESSLSRKISTVQPGKEAGSSWLVVRYSDH